MYDATRAHERSGVERFLAGFRGILQADAEAAERSHQERQASREARSRPILAEIDTQRRWLAERALPKSPLGDALRYLDNQWQPLQRFVTDGRLRIDNSGAESQLRAVAVGRKNWLLQAASQAPSAQPRSTPSSSPASWPRSSRLRTCATSCSAS